MALDALDVQTLEFLSRSLKVFLDKSEIDYKNNLINLNSLCDKFEEKDIDYLTQVDIENLSRDNIHFYTKVVAYRNVIDFISGTIELAKSIPRS